MLHNAFEQMTNVSQFGLKLMQQSFNNSMEMAELFRSSMKQCESGGKARNNMQDFIQAPVKMWVDGANNLIDMAQKNMHNFAECVSNHGCSQQQHNHKEGK